MILKELERHYWTGCIDGDGCLSAINTEDDLVENIFLCGDYYLVEGFKKFCESFGLSGNFTRDLRVKTNFWQYTLWRGDALRIMDILYKDCNHFLNRKMIRYNDLKQSKFIVYKGNEEYYKVPVNV